MSEIKYDAKEFHQKIREIQKHNTFLDVYRGKNVLIGENQSDTVSRYYEMYLLFRQIIHKYSFLLDISIASLENVITGVTEADILEADKFR